LKNNYRWNKTKSS